METKHLLVGLASISFFFANASLEREEKLHNNGDEEEEEEITFCSSTLIRLLTCCKSTFILSVICTRCVSSDGSIFNWFVTSVIGGFCSAEMELMVNELSSKIDRLSLSFTFL